MISNVNSYVDLLRRLAPNAKRLNSDSRTLRAGDVFIAVPGLRVDGRQFLAQAAQKASALVYEDDGQRHRFDVPAIAVPGLKDVLGEFAAAFYRQPSQSLFAVGITGTNGKTTVTSLTGHMCRRAGKTVRLAGNISPAALDVLLDVIKKDQLPEVWVLELSSFQLFTTYSLEPDAATVLNLTQDHLDWHGSMQAYGAAKERIFGHKTVRVLNRDDEAVMRMRIPSATVVTFGTDEPSEPGDFGLHTDHGMEWLSVKTTLDDTVMGKGRKKTVPPECVIQHLMPVDDLLIRGQHNASNALAALALCRAIHLPFAPLLQALRDYRGEPHRVETVAMVNGVTYIDDSKGTNVGATVAAVKDWERAKFQTAERSS